MIAGAGLIVASTFLNLRDFANFGVNIGQIIDDQGNGFDSNGQFNDQNDQKVSPNKIQTIKSDIDQDGLPDEEEPLYRTDPLNKDTDGDGFLDGEEVAAGCSPISASPKDCNLKPRFSQSNVNLTDYFSSLIVGGFLSNDLNESNPNFQNYIDNLANEALQIQKTVLYVDESDFSIETGTDTSKITNKEYLNNLEVALNKYFFKKSSGAEINKISDFDFSPYLNDLGNLYEELIKIKPPPNWIETHKKLTKFILELKTYFTNLDNQNEDPIKTLLTLKNTQKLLDDYEKLIEEIYGTK